MANDVNKEVTASYALMLKKNELAAAKAIEKAAKKLKWTNDPKEIAKVRDVMVILTQEIQKKYGANSAEIASQYFEALEKNATGKAVKNVQHAEVAADEASKGNVHYAVRRFFEDGAKARTVEQSRDLMIEDLSTTVKRKVKDVANDTIIKAATDVAKGKAGIKSDGLKRTSGTKTYSENKQVRYARVPHGDTCAYCTIMASRGFVYYSKEAAAKTLSKSHNHCNCTIEPGFSGTDSSIEGYNPEEYYKQYQKARDEVGSNFIEIVKEVSKQSKK